MQSGLSDTRRLWWLAFVATLASPGCVRLGFSSGVSTQDQPEQGVLRDAGVEGATWTDGPVAPDAAVEPEAAVGPDAAQGDPDAAQGDPDAAQGDPDLASPDAAWPDPDLGPPLPDSASPDTKNTPDQGIYVPDVTIQLDVFGPDAGTTPGGTVSTLAGGSAGYADGPLATALFNQPMDLALGPNGEIYVADYGNHRIRKIYQGAVTTLAGSGQGNLDGPALTAKFSGPMGVAVDGSGNVYVADAGNKLIRKISASGTVSTLTPQQYSIPTRVAVDSGGSTVYFTHYIQVKQVMQPKGTISTVVGSTIVGYKDGSANQAQFWAIYGLTLTPGGGFLLADSGNHRIRGVSSNQVTTLAGSGAGYLNGAPLASKFYNPRGVALHGSEVYVADMTNHSVRQVTTTIVVTLAGNGTKGFADGKGAAARFNGPQDVEVDGSGTLYVADTGNNRVRVISP